MILPIILAPILAVLITVPANIESDSLRHGADSASVSAPVVFDSLATSVPVEHVCNISIEQLTVSDGRLYDTLDVLMEIKNLQPAGFDLKVAVETSLIDIIEILPGEIIDSCQWSLFRPRQIAPDSVGFGPSEVWQMVALSQQMADKKGPLCYGFQRPASIARIVVSSAHLSNVADTTVGVFFYWESCRDNAVSDRQGTLTLFSKAVVDRVPIFWRSSHAAFPTRTGTPDDCINDRAPNPPQRLISFENGGVIFKAAPAPDSTDVR